MRLKLEFTESMIILVIILLVGIVIAQPGLPHQFYGTIKCQNNNNVNDNLEVTAKTSNTPIKSTSTFNGGYGYNPTFLVWNLEDNTPIEFYINDVLIGSSVFIAAEITRLDFTVPDNFCPSTSQSTQSTSGSSGSSSGSSGSSIIPDISKPKNVSVITSNIPENKTNEKSPNLQISERYSKLFGNNNFFKLNEVVALNISVISLIVMAFITLFSVYKLKQKNQKVYKENS